MGKIFTTSEVEEIVALAETDEALADMLKQLKEFCILKYPEIEQRRTEKLEYLKKWSDMWKQQEKTSVK